MALQILAIFGIRMSIDDRRKLQFHSTKMAVRRAVSRRVLEELRLRQLYTGQSAWHGMAPFLLFG